MTEETATSPVEDGDALSETGVDAAQEGQETAETADQGDQQDDAASADDEAEEVEYEGATYKVPKPLKDALLRQADYTRKTQEVAAEKKTIAETKKALDARQAEIAQEAQFAQAHIADLADLKAMDAQLAQYQQIDWDTWDQTDPDACAKAERAYNRLSRQRDAKAQDVGQKIAAKREEAQRETAKRRSDAEAEIAKAIPNWSPETKSKLASVAAEIGVTAEELENEADPRVWRLLHLASLGRQTQQQKAKADKIAQAQKTQPAHSLRGSSGQFAASPDTDDFAAFEKLADAKLRPK